MFTGVSLDQALKYWKNRKEVIVLDRTVKSPAGEGRGQASGAYC